MEFDWCVQKLEAVDRVKMGIMAQDKYQRIMSRELSQLSERSASGHRVAEWVQDITRSGKWDCAGGRWDCWWEVGLCWWEVGLCWWEVGLLVGGGTVLVGGGTVPVGAGICQYRWGRCAEQWGEVGQTGRGLVVLENN